MRDRCRLDRFIDAQAVIYSSALSELKAGTKKTHWMWFIFPQLAGLGRSQTARFYAITSIEEARAYCRHPLLGQRLRACVEALLGWGPERTAEEILGPVDAQKLKSSLTLFAAACPSGPFDEALRLFFEGKLDERTLALLNAEA